MIQYCSSTERPTQTPGRTLRGFDSGVCDRDPTVAGGKPADGALVRGVNLSDQGTGCIHLRGTDPPDTDDWGTLRMVNCIEAVGREAEALQIQIAINDLSLQRADISSRTPRIRMGSRLTCDTFAAMAMSRHWISVKAHPITMRS